MGCKVKCFCTDGGGKFMSNEFEQYLCKQGIKHQLTAPFMSVQNGWAEQTHSTIMDQACMICSSLNLPMNMWGECALTSAYVKNKMPTHSRTGTTPFEAYYGQKPTTDKSLLW